MDKYLPLRFDRPHPKYREVLFSSAFAVIEGPAYNEVADGLRIPERGRRLVLYEVVLEPYHPWEYMRDRVYPSLSRYLRYKSLDPREAEGLVVSLFFKDRFYLIRGPEFMRAFRTIEEIDEDAFSDHVTRWLSAVNP
jgi:hypothetical protein